MGLKRWVFTGFINWASEREGGWDLVNGEERPSEMGDEGVRQRGGDAESGEDRRE